MHCAYIYNQLMYMNENSIRIHDFLIFQVVIFFSIDKHILLKMHTIPTVVLKLAFLPAV